MTIKKTITNEEALLKIGVLRNQIEAKFLEIGSYADLLLSRGVHVTTIADIVGKSTRSVYNIVRAFKAVQQHRISKTDAIQLGYTKVANSASGTGPIDVAKAAATSATSLARQFVEQDDLHRKTFKFDLTQKEQELFEEALVFFGAVRRGKTLLMKEKALSEMLSLVKLSMTKHRTRRPTQVQEVAQHA